MPEYPAQVSHDPSARRRTPAWIWLAVASAAILIAALLFVLVFYLFPTQRSTLHPGASSESGTTRKTPTEENEPDSSEQPAVAPIVLPSCDTLNPAEFALAKRLYDKYAEGGAHIRYGESDYAKFSLQFGPAAQEALANSIQARDCSYPHNIEESLYTSVAELPEDAKAVLLSKLRADEDFVEGSVNGSPVFTWHQVHEDGIFASSETVHAFVGNVWYASYGPYPVEDSNKVAIAAILAANPALQ